MSFHDLPQSPGHHDRRAPLLLWILTIQVRYMIALHANVV
jgi:hypothetical protein